VKKHNFNLISVVSSLALLLLCIGNVVQAAHVSADSIVHFAAAQFSSGVYQQTAKLVELYDNQSTDTEHQSNHAHLRGLLLSSAGSWSNLKQLFDASFEFTVVRADIAEAVYQNPQRFNYEQTVEHIRTIGQLPPSYMHIIARKKGKSKRTLESLTGANIGLGLPGDATMHSIKKLFASHNLPIHAVNVKYHTLESSVRKLRDEQYEALVLIDQLPSPHVDNLLAEGKFELISLDSDIVDSFISSSSNPAIYRKAVRSTEWQSEAVVTLAIDMLLVSKDTIAPNVIEPLIPHLYSEALSKDSATKKTEFSTDSTIPMHDAVTQSTLRSKKTATLQVEQQ